ncbi:DUF4429 domain-containing protein [Sphaerisporangium krabiense]|uniref:DUF4429 domain-containing protein n=1 Tax=Sphaerisporangium krabiense TaxID=763782 RepID=A0A7W8Z1C8_9ACTN|nr:DUF4429 domain-containing protein [Sphaerisporangium krabiense]MBB5625639.1 hypothetical protein [Sphaerisporangium krabiense]
MAEVLVRDGAWVFDGESIRITPSGDRHVHKLRRLVGERSVPLMAVAGITYEPGRKGGRLRLRLREGADPFEQATRGRIADAGDPYQLAVDQDRTGVAEYFADEVRNALLIEQVPDGPCDHYLLPGPAVPLTATAGDGSAVFDGSTVHLAWNWATESGKRSAGAQQIALRDLEGVDWSPSAGLENGHIRFRVRGVTTRQQPKHDPLCLVLWGMEKETRTCAMLIAAITARLPHPFAPQDAPVHPDTAHQVRPGPARALTAAETADGSDPDALLRRLRELGDLRKDGVLTEEEFTAAKQALLRRL